MRRRVVRHMARSRGRQHSREFLSGCAPVECHGEPVLVVDALPRTQRYRRSLECLEALTTPELVVVNAVTAFDLAVLFRAARPDVAMADAAALPREDEREWKLGAVIGLDLADRDGNVRVTSATK